EWLDCSLFLHIRIKVMNEQLLALEKEADALRIDGKYQEAVDKLKEALEIDQAFVRGHLGLSVLYHHLQDYEQSCAHGEKSVQLEPDDIFNWAALSVTYQRAFEGTRDPGYIQKAEEAMARSRGM
ncbi:MAG: tetratricopeptide repeat protein, partial [Planctomycetota bacterium]